jgi:protein transport protein SEC20
MTTTDLHSRLQRLSDSTKSTSQLITNLSKLAPTTSAEDTAKERVDQSADIHQSLKDLEEELEILKQETEDYASTGNRVAGRRRDSEKEGQRVQITTQVERLGEDLKLYVARYLDPDAILPQCGRAQEALY